jgi:hypothetical protein
MDDGVAAPREGRRKRVDEEIEDEAVLDVADSEEIGPGPIVHLGDDRGELKTFRSRRAGVQPATSAPIARCRFSVRRGEFSSSKVLEVPPRGRRHPTSDAD